MRENFLFCNGAEYNEQINIQEVCDISNNIPIDHIKNGFEDALFNGTLNVKNVFIDVYTRELKIEFDIWYRIRMQKL